jgi:hypothetical protein
MARRRRDWPLPADAWDAFVWLILIAVLSISARQALGAEPPPTRAASSAASEVQAAPDPVDALLDDLAAVEDPALEDHVAAGSLTAGELALVIVFLILLFPVGIILLIVFLLDDD